MTKPRNHTVLNPTATRLRILEAALALISENGSKNLTLTDVTRRAGVHRGTIYQHFRTRDDLLAATAELFSERFYNAVIGKEGMQDTPRPEAPHMIGLNDRLANFVMDNPELCRIWLFQVLSSSDPAKDPFWQEYEGAYRRFAKTELAQDDMDSEVMSVLVLAGAILWPVWARATEKTADQRKFLARRFTDQLLRVSMHGSLKPEFFPEIEEHLKSAKR